MGMLAARHAARVLDGARRLVAIELLCGAHALELRQAGAGTRAAYDAIRRVAAPLADDRGLRDDVPPPCSGGLQPATARMTALAVAG